MMPEFPDRLRSAASTVFERRPNLYSVHREGAEASDEALAVVRDDAKGTFEVYDKPARGGALKAGEVGPVYSVGRDGPLAVPTGRIFIRLAEGVRPETRRSQFASAGFEIERTLSYAPNAAWLTPKEGGVARALSGLADLAKTPDVVHVEPQLLMQRALKDR